MRRVRFVTDSNCDLVVVPVVVSAAAISNFATFVSELQGQGFDRSDRKYMAWTDANVYCGIGEIYLDDSPNAVPGLPSSNANNGNPLVTGAVARVDNGCWGLVNSVEAHELVHGKGGVQRSAPRATQGFHCTDDFDLMCYLDGTAPNTLQQVCPANQENRLDCNNNDYFHTAAPSGSYLDSHWNVADSAFLSTSDPPAPPPPVVVAIAGSSSTERLMGDVAAALDGSVVLINGSPTAVRVFNIPTSP